MEEILTLILLTHNRYKSGFLQSSIKAILKQTYKRFRLIVADNHSIDNTSNFVLSLNDERITYLRQPKRTDQTTNALCAATMCTSKYIGIVHDDDIMEKKFLEKQIKFLLKNPKILCSSTNVKYIDENSQVIQPRLYNLNKNIIFPKTVYIKKYFEEKFWLPTPTMIYERDTYIEVVKKSQKYMKLKHWPGRDINDIFNINLLGSVGIISEPLLRYRQHYRQDSRMINQVDSMKQVLSLFLNQNKKNKLLKEKLHIVYGFFLRMELQTILLNDLKKQKKLMRIKLLLTKWEKYHHGNKNCVDAILPLYIIAYLMKMNYTLPLNQLRLLCKRHHKSGSQLAYRQWLCLRLKNRNLFRNYPNLKNIAIFGSMLTAYLIIEEAITNRIKVIHCYDSSPSRINKVINDVRIISLEKLKKNLKGIDLLVLSNEQDQEIAIKKYIKKYTQTKFNRIISWKDLL